MPDDHQDRSRRHARVAGALAAMSDAEVGTLAAAAEGRAGGVGGHTGTIEVGGVPVFVKNVPVTALELAHRHSTANLFGLPMHYHYGIGSAGFGAWRELATHELTTGWVLSGAFAGFPLMYHWRVRPHPPEPVDVEQWDEHWHRSPAIRRRLVALAEAPAVVTLFLELLPYTMDRWLTERSADPEWADAGSTGAGSTGAESAGAEWADAELRRGAAFMRSHGLLHLDAHFHNLLTDGHRVYFADFGLALHEGFDLDAEEAAFLERHRGYDAAYVRAHLHHWLARHDKPAIARNRDVAASTLDFWRRLEADRRTPYPAEQIDRAADQ
ncbi:serine/threonine protein phosphatase [Actinoplanes sp. NPDC089786]|uniref:serine/threonine protein phosphatase n=1 Tax=Actinoplanes sp. NPDC089786 TaxID=3155185 RepID=UPI003448FE0C